MLGYQLIRTKKLKSIFNELEKRAREIDRLNKINLRGEGKLISLHDVRDKIRRIKLEGRFPTKIVLGRDEYSDFKGILDSIFRFPNFLRFEGIEVKEDYDIVGYYIKLKK